MTFGGLDGTNLQIASGDLLVVPAGTKHRRIAPSDNSLSIGAYPAGRDWDVRWHVAGADGKSRIAAVPLPISNSLDGPDGPLMHLWKHSPMIDINTASADEIDTLPQLEGHGFEIVRYRQERGRFDKLRQLEEVPGLAGKTAGLDRFIAFD